MDFSQCLNDMGGIYRANPAKAVRGQGFIRCLRTYLIGVYDQFAYLVVEFDQVPPQIRDDIVQASVPN